ncbi:hypothetical protein V1477_007145 [Vespula maculifrons]|uniref:Uncharacterized protein n=1 Tax=Vespula maculifrons TaxID=7453 RepID=A0ABD2CKA2_VESMC
MQSFLSYADECTSQDTFLASNNGKLIITLWSGDTGIRETITKSISVGLRPILMKHPLNATGASIDDDFTQVQCGIIHILHILYYFFCFRLRSALWKDLDSVSPRVNLEIFTDTIRVSIDEQLIQIYNHLNAKWGNLPPVTTTKSLLVQLCFELRGVDLEIFEDDIRVSINEYLFDFRLKCDVGLCVGLRPVSLEIFTNDIRVSINEQLIQIYNSLFDFRLKCDVGLLVQLCFELRGVDLEIFADDIRVNLNAKWGYTPTRDDNKVGSLTDPYSYSFSCALNFEEWT